ncbi:hypothetical protein BST81_13665 [Leptolyngbya sp. 'hensonii']|uniref:NfeD family protein n=1 Tax=Leptolyngbya sp. 'hensonii' TaxID=1922337 RepID=UPI00094FAF2D|nr:NfeD family protein [Leptolyngbya sp. 'hensonii']OLP18069.1 hypothetical protein BST81_13665 [Leptolyngbya sp. 'hensonii']
MQVNLIQTFYNLLKSSDRDFTDPRLNNWQGEAMVEEAILPGHVGRVRFQGSWWPARCEHNLILGCGGVVRVIGIENITLLVEP